MRYAARIRDVLTPWLVVAIASLVVLPLVLTAGCDLACSLGAMPAGACTHQGMAHSHGHSTGELASVFPFAQQVLAAAGVLALIVAMTAAAVATPAPASSRTPVEVRAGTRMRN